MKVSELLRTIIDILSPTVERAPREAQLILMYSLGVDELWLLLNQDFIVDDIQMAISWAKRRSNNEPLEYISNRVSFYSEEFYISYGALIPRPETELLIDEVIKNMPNRDEKLIFAEVGVGSGIISVMLARLYKNAKIIAIDISQDAIEIAKINIERFGVGDQVELRHGSLLEPVTQKIDYLVSNPPYIANDALLEANLAYEPQNALFGGVVGDEIIKELLDEVLRRNISFFTCEMGYDQKDRIRTYLNDKQLKNLEFYKDLSGFDRGFTLRV